MKISVTSLTVNHRYKRYLQRLSIDSFSISAHPTAGSAMILSFLPEDHRRSRTVCIITDDFPNNHPTSIHHLVIHRQV